jgi:hypothetical protein
MFSLTILSMIHGSCRVYKHSLLPQNSLAMESKLDMASSNMPICSSITPKFDANARDFDTMGDDLAQSAK